MTIWPRRMLRLIFNAQPTGFEPVVFSVTGRRVNRATPRLHCIEFIGNWNKKQEGKSCPFDKFYGHAIITDRKERRCL